MIDFETFISDCDKGKCNRSTIKSLQCQKEYKRKLCYTKYEKQFARNKEKQGKDYLKNKDKEQDIDYKWIDVCKLVKLRDNNQCRLYNILTKEEKLYLLKEQKENIYFNKTLGCAHVVPRSASKKLFYESTNVYLLGWCFHFRLDNLQSPLTGQPIAVKEHDDWWIRIIGQETWDWLQENK
jgi:hypothetical protein